MSEKLTPWWVAEGLGKYAMTDELLALRARVAKLEAALEEALAAKPWLRNKVSALAELSLEAEKANKKR